MPDHDVAVSESEQELIEIAQRAVSQSNWVVGECAYKWTTKYARGRTDGDFGVMVGLTADQVFQRRRVWETFGDVHTEYGDLKWSHFYVAVNWDDAPECLQWSLDNDAKVAEMKAWRRAQHGEDLTQETSATDDWGAEHSISISSSEATPVRDPDEFQTGTGGASSGSREPADTAPAFARDVNPGEPGDSSDYSPFRKGAASPPPKSEQHEVAVLEKPQMSPERAIKRMTSTLERMHKALTPDVAAEFQQLPEKLRIRFVQAVSDLNTKVAEANL